ncbi:MAG: PepSY domain-containing protein [Clostridia bacterium]
MNEKINDNNIEKRLDSSFDELTPNIIQQILADCSNQAGLVIEMKNKTNKNIDVNKLNVTEAKFSDNLDENPGKPLVIKNKNRNKFIALAACFCVLIALGAGFMFAGGGESSSVSKVSLDVNPSIEFDVSDSGKIEEISAKNDDGVEIIDDVNLVGADVQEAVSYIVSALISDGYLTAQANSILISVDNDDEDVSENLKAEIQSAVDAALSENGFDGAVLSLSVEGTNENELLASQYGISLAKVVLIQEILEINQSNTKYTYTFESLAALSINELNLLLGENETSSVTSSGSASDTSYIGASKASEIALADAGTGADFDGDVEVGLDFDDGVIVYEVEFIYDEIDYEYEINATTGAIMDIKTEKIGDGDFDGFDYDYDDYDDDFEDDEYDDDDAFDDADDFEVVGYDNEPGDFANSFVMTSSQKSSFESLFKSKTWYKLSTYTLPEYGIDSVLTAQSDDGDEMMYIYPWTEQSLSIVKIVEDDGDVDYYLADSSLATAAAAFMADFGSSTAVVTTTVETTTSAATTTTATNNSVTTTNSNATTTTQSSSASLGSIFVDDFEDAHYFTIVGFDNEPGDFSIQYTMTAAQQDDFEDLFDWLDWGDIDDFGTLPEYGLDCVLQAKTTGEDYLYIYPWTDQNVTIIKTIDDDGDVGYHIAEASLATSAAAFMEQFK